jgi:hypothetical protein
MIDAKIEKIKQLKTEITELRKESILLSDKHQQFTEKEEEVLICGRPKKYETKLIGRIHWKDDFVDEDTGDVITIDRTQIVRINGEWQQYYA